MKNNKNKIFSLNKTKKIKNSLNKKIKSKVYMLLKSKASNNSFNYKFLTILKKVVLKLWISKLKILLELSKNDFQNVSNRLLNKILKKDIEKFKPFKILWDKKTNLESSTWYYKNNKQNNNKFNKKNKNIKNNNNQYNFNLKIKINDINKYSKFKIKNLLSLTSYYNLLNFFYNKKIIFKYSKDTNNMKNLYLNNLSLKNINKNKFKFISIKRKIYNKYKYLVHTTTLNINPYNKNYLNYNNNNFNYNNKLNNLWIKTINNLIKILNKDNNKIINTKYFISFMPKTINFNSKYIAITNNNLINNDINLINKTKNELSNYQLGLIQNKLKFNNIKNLNKSNNISNKNIVINNDILNNNNLLLPIFKNHLITKLETESQKVVITIDLNNLKKNNKNMSKYNNYLRGISKNSNTSTNNQIINKKLISNLNFIYFIHNNDNNIINKNVKYIINLHIFNIFKRIYFLDRNMNFFKAKNFFFYLILIDKYNLNNLFSVNNLINTNTKKMLNLFKQDKFNNTNIYNNNNNYNIFNEIKLSFKLAKLLISENSNNYRLIILYILKKINNKILNQKLNYIKKVKGYTKNKYVYFDKINFKIKETNKIRSKSKSNPISKDLIRNNYLTKVEKNINLNLKNKSLINSVNSVNNKLNKKKIELFNKKSKMSNFLNNNNIKNYGFGYNFLTNEYNNNKFSNKMKNFLNNNPKRFKPNLTRFERLFLKIIKKNYFTNWKNFTKNENSISLKLTDKGLFDYYLNLKNLSPYKYNLFIDLFNDSYNPSRNLIHFNNNKSNLNYFLNNKLKFNSLDNINTNINLLWYLNFMNKVYSNKKLKIMTNLTNNLYDTNLINNNNYNNNYNNNNNNNLLYSLKFKLFKLNKVIGFLNNFFKNVNKQINTINNNNNNNFKLDLNIKNNNILKNDNFNSENLIEKNKSSLKEYNSNFNNELNNLFLNSYINQWLENYLTITKNNLDVIFTKENVIKIDQTLDKIKNSLISNNNNNKIINRISNPVYMFKNNNQINNNLNINTINNNNNLIYLNNSNFKFNNQSQYLLNLPVLFANKNISLKKNNLNLNNKHIFINQFLKNMSIYNIDIQGTFIHFNKFIAYNFNHNSNKLVKDIYDILFFAFKSMSCLISKPVFSFKNDKIIIHLFYYLISPTFLKYHRPVFIINKSNKIFSTTNNKTTNLNKNNINKYIIKNNNNNNKKFYILNILHFYKNRIYQINKIHNHILKFNILNKNSYLLNNLIINCNRDLNLINNLINNKEYNKESIKFNELKLKLIYNFFINFKRLNAIIFIINKLISFYKLRLLITLKYKKVLLKHNKIIRNNKEYINILDKNNIKNMINKRNKKFVNLKQFKGKWFKFKKIQKLFFFKKKKKIRNYYEKLASMPLTQIYPEKFDALCFILSKFFNKPVELNLIRVHYPYSNSNILVNFFALFMNNVKINRFVRKLFKFTIFKNIFKNKFNQINKFKNKKNKFNKFNNNNKINNFNNLTQNNNNNNSTIIPAFLSGFKIKIGGRLLKQSIKVRKTVAIHKKGIYAKGKVNFIDFARFTGKNKRGIFSISIDSSQTFFNKY